MTFWPSLHRHKQNYGWQMHFINQTHLQFSSSPRIVPASSQIITNPRNLLKIVAWLEWRNEIHLRYSCEWKLCWKDLKHLWFFDRQIPIFLDRLLANDASMTRQNHDQYCNSPPWSLLWTYSAPRWALSPEVTPSSGTPLPDLGVRADFIQVVYKMTFWPCLRRQRQNYGCQMHFINQTPLQFPLIPNIFKNDHKSQKSSQERGMTAFWKAPMVSKHSISFYGKDLASQFRYWTFSLEVTPSSGTPKLFIKWLSDHVCVDKDRITDAKCIL